MRKGFTLIELLVVIAIIGLLSAIVFGALNASRAKARDGQRKEALVQLRNAMELYYSKCGTYIIRQNCTGTAYGSSGVGFFDYTTYAGSAGSLAQGLVDAGTMPAVATDPSGEITHSSGKTGYMLSANANRFTIWANLESPSADDIATMNSCPLDSYDSYKSSYPASERTNYCVGNQ